MTGAVYDRGYRPYEGVRGGRSAARAALWRATLRRALGLRRPWRQKVAPFSLLAIVTVPAVVNVGLKYLTRNTPASELEFITYRDYVGVSNALLVFVALTAPDIVCPDRRQRVLPLIFARPLRGVDYVAAKVGAMAAIVFAFSFLPQVVLFVGQMLVSDDGALTYLRDNAEVLWQVPAAVALLAVFYAVVGVAIASLTARRIIAGACIVGLFLVTSITAAVLVGPRYETRVATGGEEGSGWHAHDGDADDQRRGPGPAEGGPGVVTGGAEGIPPGGGSPSPSTGNFHFVRAEPSAAPLLNVAGLPLILRDVVFLGEVDPGHPMSGLDDGALYAAGVYLLWVGAGLVVLLRRYHEVER